MNDSFIWLVILLAFLAGLFFLLRIFIRRMNAASIQMNSKFPSAAEEVASGEPQIPKTKVTPEELGKQFVKWLQTDPPTLPLNTLPIDRLTTEFLYLQTFTFDLAAYLKLGDSYEKKVILDVFWDYITGAGVYTETFQLRMLHYTDAAKEVGADNIHETLGRAFAEICGTPGDVSIMEAGANMVQFIMTRISQLFDHVTIDTGLDTSTGKLPSLEST